MTVDGDGSSSGSSSAHADERFPLHRAVASLYSDLRLTPTLHTLLARTRELTDGVAGSLSIIDPETGTYWKVAERGISCQLGRTFSLDQGATGRAVEAGRPVVIDDYSALNGRHLPPDHAANRGSVVAVPIWWRGDLIGVNVAFAGSHRRFTGSELDRLEVLSQTAAGAIVTAGVGDPALAKVLGSRSPGPRCPTCAGVTADGGGHRSTTPGPAAQEASGVTAVTAAPCPLTLRETQVLEMVARGLGDREIARRLVLSPKTVEKHVGSAIRKTHSASRTAAAVRALERGWIQV